MRIEVDVKLDYQDVLLRPKRSTLSSRKEVQLERNFTFYHSPKKWRGVPIMAANMLSCGTIEIARIFARYQLITALHKFYSVEELQQFFEQPVPAQYLCYTTGIRKDDFEKMHKLKKLDLLRFFDFICLDVPNGYIEKFQDYIKKLRQEFPEHIIIAGNVVTNEMTEELILAGADIVKVGIGPGSVCTTRRMTGVGYPQLSAVIECSDAAHGISNSQGCGLIVADGGQQFPSCVVKAFCGGADFNMCGSLFSGFVESGGKLVERDGKQYKEFFGLSSNKVLKEYYGKKESHRAAEGRYTLIPLKGEIEYFLQDLFGSLRSAGTYIGAKKLKEFSRRATFLRVNSQLNRHLEPFEASD